MEQRYYIRSRGRVEGPFTTTRLHELARRGRFGRHHHVSQDRKTWERASAHPELFPESGPVKLRQVASGPVAPDTAEQLQERDVDDQRDWYYSNRGQQVDEPVSFAKLKELAASGQLSETDYVWTEGMEQWVEATQALPGAFPDSTDGDDSKYPPGASASLATPSLIFGILGLTLLPLLGSILGIVFGHLAVGQIARSGGQLGGRTMAITGFVLGYVALAIAMIVGIIMICLALSAGPTPPQPVLNS